MPFLPRAYCCQSAGGLSYLLIVGLVGPWLIRWASTIEFGRGPVLGFSKMLGWLSYPIYCLHVPVMALLHYLAQQNSLTPNQEKLLLPIAFFSLTFLLALGLGKAVDEPVRRWLTRYSTARRTLHQGSATA